MFSPASHCCTLAVRVDGIFVARAAKLRGKFRRSILSKVCRARANFTIILRRRDMQRLRHLSTDTSTFESMFSPQILCGCEKHLDQRSLAEVLAIFVREEL